MPDMSEVSEAGGQALPEEVQAAIDAAQQEAQEGPQEVPSVFSTRTSYIVGGAVVSPPAEDGSRVLQLVSGNRATVVEVNLSPELCGFIAQRLTEVEVIEQDADPAPAGEEAPDGAERETD